MKVSVPIIFVFFVSFSCSEKIEKTRFNFFLSESCMILNYEKDNTIEGTYIIVDAISLKDSSISLKNQNDHSLKFLQNKNWVIGWGNNKPLYDAGVENLRMIKKIDYAKNKIYLGKLVRGSGLPKRNQKLVFWNSTPSDFINKLKKPIINPKMWPQFSGESIGFASIEFDNILQKWVILVNECDNLNIQIYAAISDNLVDWEAANNGKPILTASDFEKCTWAGKDRSGKIKQTPFVSDIIRHKNKWHLLLDGYDEHGKRHIGTATSKSTLIGPYVISKNPILSPGEKGSWNDEAVFYAKVKKYKDGVIMFYDGRNSDGYEQIGMSFSRDFIRWTHSKKNPVIDQHQGWRSAVGCSEPNLIEVRGDSIILMVAGVKKFKMGPWHHYVTGKMYKDLPGNVDDAQLGVFLSIDGGTKFKPHVNNPIFINDYSNKFENEHMGGNFKLIQTDTADFIIYQAKSSFEGSKYNILLRVRDKK